MYELYIGNRNYSSWSLRPWVLMQAHGLPFSERVHPFQPGGNWAAFREFSPSGKVPCLRDGEVVVWDSLAICEYLAERHAGLWAASPAARAWSRSAAAEMHSGFTALRQHCGMNVALRVRLREWPEPLLADVRRVAELWNEGLARFGGPFLAGSTFTVVDAFYCPVAFRVRTYQVPLDGAAREYAQRLLELPAMRAWEAAAVAEPWRDEAHDAEVAAVGEILEDRRQSGASVA